jgi:hypothetical protein
VTEIIEELDDGLILRRATTADTDALATFHADILRDPGANEPNPFVDAWIRDLMTGTHPTFDPGDFTIVETPAGEIVSSLNLISQTWAYDGVPFGVGRTECASTRPDYRRRGLVRRQFDVVHRWSAERGELVQGITGIPYFYRQFGYEMALELGGGRAGSSAGIPDLAPDAEEHYRVRPATSDDLPFIVEVDGQCQRRLLVTAVRDGTLWAYELSGRGERRQRQVRVIERGDGQPVGFLDHYRTIWGRHLEVIVYELAVGISWLAVTPSVLRYLRSTGDDYAGRDGSEPFDGISMRFGTDHPVYRAIPRLLPQRNPDYAWYLRVPDLPAFLRRIAPVLEQRLAESIAPGHSGELKIGFYDDGLRLVFETGRLATVEPWSSPQAEGDAARFPPLTFLQLLFGYRSLSELEYAAADITGYNDESQALLDALFPKRPSHVVPID